MSKDDVRGGEAKGSDETVLVVIQELRDSAPSDLSLAEGNVASNVINMAAWLRERNGYTRGATSLSSPEGSDENLRCPVIIRAERDDGQSFDMSRERPSWVDLERVLARHAKDDLGGSVGGAPTSFHKGLIWAFVVLLLLSVFRGVNLQAVLSNFF